MWAEPTEVTPDVTVNLEGLWLLQALLGIPQLATELRVRPYGAARTDEWQVDHPGIEVLREGGLVDDAGRVLEQFASRLQVLAAPDVEVAALISRGGPLATAQMSWTIRRPGAPYPTISCELCWRAATVAGCRRRAPARTSRSKTWPAGVSSGWRRWWQASLMWCIRPHRRAYRRSTSLSKN